MLIFRMFNSMHTILIVRVRVRVRAGPDFRLLEGNKFIFKKAIYGLKYAGSSFISFISHRLDGMGFTFCVADTDVWRRPEVKSEGTYYYEYVMTYVDYIIDFSMDSVCILEDIERFLSIKNDNIYLPSDYLGVVIFNNTVDDVNFWTISGKKYFKAVLDNVVEGLRSNTYLMTSKVVTTMEQLCLPDMDTSKKLDTTGVQYYQYLIGILCWATELGWVNLLHGVSILSQYQDSTRFGHLDEVIHIFSLLGTKQKLQMWIGPKEPSIYYVTFIANK